MEKSETYEPGFGDFFALLKPRVMSLVVFTALAGVVVAPAELHWFEAFCAVLFIAIGAGASGALNMWWDADIDRIMARTVDRPVPSGRVSAETALGLGAGLSFLSVMMLGLATNWHAAFWLAFTIFFYAVIYTMWLKRTTPQNIVIGGAAGAFPPLVGWVAVTGSLSVEAWLMFALIFMWTPPHFWALALFMKSDYHDAKVPMLTVTHGRDATRKHIFVYALLLVPFALALLATSIGGWASLVTAVPMNIYWVWGAWQIWQKPDQSSLDDDHALEKRFFKFSLLYLFAHFAALMIDRFFGLGF